LVLTLATLLQKIHLLMSPPKISRFLMPIALCFYVYLASHLIFILTQNTITVMGQPAARISDMHTCPLVNPGPVPHVGGPIIKGEITVLIGNLPAARVGDMAVCVGPPDSIIKGSTSVMIGKMPAARMGDSTAHGGVIVVGLPTVLIG
jgi:uncharacterized Zn-binding protein involved in type VI secretion